MYTPPYASDDEIASHLIQSSAVPQGPPANKGNTSLYAIPSASSTSELDVSFTFPPAAAESRTAQEDGAQWTNHDFVHYDWLGGGLPASRQGGEVTEQLTTGNLTDFTPSEASQTRAGPQTSSAPVASRRADKRDSHTFLVGNGVNIMNPAMSWKTNTLSDQSQPPKAPGHNVIPHNAQPTDFEEDFPRTDSEHQQVHGRQLVWTDLYKPKQARLLKHMRLVEIGVVKSHGTRKSRSSYRRELACSHCLTRTVRTGEPRLYCDRGDGKCERKDG